jgi:hypothetical protein
VQAGELAGLVSRALFALSHLLEKEWRRRGVVAVTR